MKDAAIEVAVYNMFDIRSEKAIVLCKPIIMNLFQQLEIVFNTLIIFRKFRFFLYTVWLQLFSDTRKLPEFKEILTQLGIVKY